MSVNRCLSYSAFIGAAVAGIFVLLRILFPVTSVSGLLDKPQLLLWPTSIWLIAATGGGRLGGQLYVLATLGNMALYAILGLFLWYGLRKSLLILVIEGILILGSWALLLQL